MTSTDDESLIRAAIEARVLAVRDKNVDAVLAGYVPEVVTFDVVTPLQHEGRAAVRKRLSDWFSSFESAIDYDIVDLAVAVAGDVAFDHHLTKVHAVRRGGQVIAMWFRETIGYRKVDGAWKVTHQHSSVPIDMESGKGRMDLAP
ncbi:MAG: nuclear transport factor 2 family protein [Polyangiaceae bacterium]|jgi:ketosteroid isomerase-like protein